MQTASARRATRTGVLITGVIERASALTLAQSSDAGLQPIRADALPKMEKIVKLVYRA